MFNKKGVIVFCTILFILALVAGWTQPAAAKPAAPLSVSQTEGVNGTTLSATVDLTLNWTRTFKWTIDKSVDKPEWNLFTGKSGTSEYTVAVTKDAGTDASWVNGQVCVTNGGVEATENLAINMLLKNGYPPPKDTAGSGTADVTGHPVLAPGETYCYPYTVNIVTLDPDYPQPHEGGSYKVLAIITITNHSGSLGVPSGPSPSAYAVMPPITLINNSINVDDTNGSSWLFSASGSVDYEKEFKCDTDAGKHDNTATIRETGQSDSASVTVNCYKLDVTVNPQQTITYGWTIEKSVSPATWDLFNGDSGTSNYLVKVTKDAGTNASWVDGQVCLTYSGAMKSVETSNPTSITVDIINSGNEILTQVPVPTDVSSLSSLSPSCYKYNAPISPSPQTGDVKAVANATITTGSGETISGTANSATLPFPDPTEINGSVDVTDTNGGKWNFTASGSETYDSTFTCDKDQGKKDNTATITKTETQPELSASASVTVNCYDLSISKTADTSFKRDYNWDVSKTGDQTSLKLALNEKFLVNYTVTAKYLGYTDSDWKASGKVTVTNPAPIDAKLNGVVDMMGAESVPLTCDVEFPYTLAAGGSLDCSYTVALSDATQRLNTGTATLQNTPSGTTEISAKADVIFGKPIETNKCIDVSDSMQGALGQVCAADSSKDFEFTYSRDVGPYATCGNYTVDNTATIKSVDTDFSKAASWSVVADLPCQVGCTLTIGYWKTHSGFIKTQPDAITPLLPQWLGTTSATKSLYIKYSRIYNATYPNSAVRILSFYGSNNVVNASNGINKLYAQLLAAKLNISKKTGANGSSVAAIITSADAWLATHNTLNWTTLTTAQKNQVLNWAAKLDQFNNGLIGPGHCSQ